MTCQQRPIPRFPQQLHPDYAIPRATDDLLSPGTRMGAVELLVHDLDTVLDFYHKGMRLEVISHEKAQAARLADFGHEAFDDGRTLEFRDPWNSLIRVNVAE